MATDDGVVALTVYSRSWCHLCDEMIAGLRTLQARFHFSVAIVDVDSDERLEAIYSEDIPVLLHGEHELCRHRLDSARVTDYLEKIG
jgi:thiol-disulfide isomerase/thioredoxin